MSAYDGVWKSSHAKVWLGCQQAEFCPSVRFCCDLSWRYPRGCRVVLLQRIDYRSFGK